MNILVTGGAGFVGSACLRWLVKHGHNPIAYDNLKEGHIGAVPSGRLVIGDIANTDALVTVMTKFKIDAVMHFAAATYVGESVTNPDYHYSNNVSGTLSLLRAMQKAGVKRLLFSSTCAMIRDFAHAYGLGFTLLRYFNAAGADPDGTHGEDHRPETHLIPLVLEVPLGKRKELTIFGNDYSTPDGTCVRDYIHTSDLAQAHHLAIEATTPTTSEVYNIGTGNGQSNLQIIRACEQVTGTKIPFQFGPRRPGDPPALVADPTKLKTKLGWKPQFADIVKTVETAWKWHTTHRNGYAD